MIQIGSPVDNRTICDLFGVANIGGIRVCRARNLIVLISNHTDTVYRNEWRDGILHFVGMGSVGPQKLDRQNKTLANSKRSGAKIYLFEVPERSQYTYAGEFELADEPYMSDQSDARAAARFVWMFPLRRKQPTPDGTSEPARRSADHLPHGAYAVISTGLSDDRLRVVNQALDRLKEAGITVIDQRDIDHQRYEAALGRWHEAVLDHVRSTVRQLYARRKQRAKAENRTFALIDDELKINSASTESELRQALSMLDRDDPTAMQEVFDQAMAAVPMPEMPKSLADSIKAEPIDPADIRVRPAKRIDRSKFKDFT